MTIHLLRISKESLNHAVGQAEVNVVHVELVCDPGGIAQRSMPPPLLWSGRQDVRKEWREWGFLPIPRDRDTADNVGCSRWGVLSKPG